MKKEDFNIPSILDKERKLILKGKVYGCQETLVMATETTCSLTKDSFNGICVGIDEDWRSNDMPIVGSRGEWRIDAFVDKN